jgi:predicted Zn-dependent protease
MIVKPAGETADEFARRMATSDRPLETFLLLNGLERGAALHTGESYKLVVD